MIINIRFLPTITFTSFLLLALIVYYPGLKGGFLFDDYPNLAEMAKYGDMSNWENVKRFISNGEAGPTGRPISLLTFVPQADDWFSNNATSFKIINLFIHLLCGLLLYWVTQLLLKSYGYAEQKIRWIALLSVSFWLLHPLFVSTTLYVVQRMAQLPLLFSLLAMLGYFKGRTYIIHRPFFAYSIMTLSIGLGTILATYSKENGALLPLLLLIIEFCNPNLEGKPVWYWHMVCLWLPSLAITILLIRYIDLSETPWLNRPFNQKERLWSEARIVCSYLIQLFVPRIEGNGLFQDGYSISKGWLSPPSTLISFIFLCGLLASGFILRNKYPLFSLAILFFFAAHLMESTVIGLELYFEHRNYIAAIFLFLPIAAGIYKLSDQINPLVLILISLLILGLFAWTTWQRSLLWSNTTKLQLYWAQHNPNSPRAQSTIARGLMANKQYEATISFLENATQQHPTSGLLAFQLLLVKITSNQVTKADFIELQQKIPQQYGEAQMIQGIQDMVFSLLANNELLENYGNDAINTLDILMLNPSYQKLQEFKAVTSYLKGFIFLEQKKPSIAYEQFKQAILQSNEVDGLSLVAALGNAGYLEQGLDLLDVVQNNYQQKSDSMLKKPRVYYDEAIKVLRKNLQNDLQYKRLRSENILEH